ncbi:RNA polymerase sigma factor [Parapedobacter sp. 10938]|uniref:RNA polymerase sigma factor n=1 Tax=Parapedobacter flavus TaxID=3110225 RepID=UPI002DBD692D|nr:RNA polymerase sigma-70 factor [Parapedobacter sp. 10938]MEC3880514.1 RNA polymerase sigma-70 factor [Parapedobacter sp. 10938]
MPSIDSIDNEHELLTRLQNGDDTAFDGLYHRYSNRIYGRLLKLTRSVEISEELLQDVFMKVWEHRERINPALPFKSYLFRIAEHLISDYYRRAAKDRRVYDHLLHVGTAHEQPFDEEREHQLYQRKLDRLQEALGQLPRKCREVYTLCKIEGKSYREVASELDMSTATISNHMTKANKLIRSHLNIPATAILILQICLG